MQWQVSPVGFSASDGWALKWTFVRAGAHYFVNGEPQDDGSFIATLTVADSLWTPGEYEWQCRAKKDVYKETIATGRITVQPSFEEYADGYDGRTHTERTLAIIRDAIEGRVAQTESSWSVDTPDGPRSVSLLSPEQLMTAEQIYTARLAREQQDAAMAKGYGASRLFVRLGSRA